MAMAQPPGGPRRRRSRLARELTSSQAIAAAQGTSASNIYIEAGPGTGKTMVSAARFGVLRFHANEDRGVLALSFTRAATAELSRRVRLLWGPTCLRWPNRIETLDKLLLDLLHDLLEGGLILWPGGATELQVFDSWAALGQQAWSSVGYELVADGNAVLAQETFETASRQRVPGSVVVPLLNAGACTHDDVREVMAMAIDRPDCQGRIRERLAESFRSVIVDEIFDANELDLRLVQLMLQSGVGTTLVGDPWQALYVFRGATPDAVGELISHHAIPRADLTDSFRWKTEAQRSLATDLRAGSSVAIEIAESDEVVDVALSSTWKPLWDLGEEVLPLAFGSFKGGYEEAGATLLLHYFALRTVNESATYLRDALRALAITELDLPSIDRQLESTLNRLRAATPAATREAYAMLCEAVHSLSPRRLRPAHHAHTNRLKLLGQRIRGASLLVPGLTIHQAKGREWDRVGVKLDDFERERLRNGLTVAADADRRLYVALTRARYRTMELA